MNEPISQPVAEGRHVMFPNHYAWFVLASTLDILMTAIVLNLGGIEVNPIADFVIGRFGMHGAMIFKFLMVIFVVCMCEMIGRRNLARGRQVASFAIIVPTFGALMGYTLVARAMGI